MRTQTHTHKHTHTHTHTHTHIHTPCRSPNCPAVVQQCLQLHRNILCLFCNADVDCYSCIYRAYYCVQAWSYRWVMSLFYWPNKVLSRPSSLHCLDNVYPAMLTSSVLYGACALLMLIACITTIIILGRCYCCTITCGPFLSPAARLAAAQTQVRKRETSKYLKVEMFSGKWDTLSYMAQAIPSLGVNRGTGKHIFKPLFPHSSVS